MKRQIKTKIQLFSTINFNDDTTELRIIVLIASYCLEFRAR